MALAWRAVASRLVTDPLTPLLELADVRETLGAARAAVDAAFDHRALRRQGGQVAAEVSLRSARASAALAGHAYELDDLRAGTVTDAVAQGALRVAQELGTLVDTWRRAPRQALARLHVLAGRGIVADADVGRPDPAAATRLDGLAGLVAGGTRAPVLLVAAVVHGELLALEAFPGVNGVVARGAARLTLIAGGLDPRGLVPVDVGHADREPEYVGAAHAFATGTADGLRAWLRHYAAAITRAAEETRVICDLLA